MMAANATMIDRRSGASSGAARVVSTRAISRNTRITGNSNESPNARIISETSEMYLSAVSSGWRSDPPMLSRNFSAGSSVRSATTAPIANSTIDERMNGIAYFFSVGFRPGVMNRHSCQSQTGSARTMPP